MALVGIIRFPPDGEDQGRMTCSPDGSRLAWFRHLAAETHSWTFPSPLEEP